MVHLSLDFELTPDSRPHARVQEQLRSLSTLLNQYSDLIKLQPPQVRGASRSHSKWQQHTRRYTHKLCVCVFKDIRLGCMGMLLVWCILCRRLPRAPRKSASHGTARHEPSTFDYYNLLNPSLISHWRSIVVYYSPVGR